MLTYRNHEALLAAAPRPAWSMAHSRHGSCPWRTNCAGSSNRPSTSPEKQLGRGAVAAVLADSDPAFSAVLRAHLVRQLNALQGVIDADIDAGHVRAGTDGEALAELAFSACIGQLLRHGRARKGWTDVIVEVLIHGTSPAPG